MSCLAHNLDARGKILACVPRNVQIEVDEQLITAVNFVIEAREWTPAEDGGRAGAGHSETGD